MDHSDSGRRPTTPSAWTGGSHRQWKWVRNSNAVKFYADIRLCDTGASGHNITFENSDSMVLIPTGVAMLPANFKDGQSGTGEKHDKHSHGIQGDVEWKCTGTETQNMIV